MSEETEAIAAQREVGRVLVYMAGEVVCRGKQATGALDDRFELVRCESYQALLKALGEGVPDVVVMDDEAAIGREQMLPRLAVEFRRQYEFPYLPIVVLAASLDVDSVVRCMKGGADYVVSNSEAAEKLAPRLLEAAEQHRLMGEVHQLVGAHRRRGKFGDLVGVSPAMQNVFSIVRNVAATDAPVFITGESGTGKELVASALHKFSRRREGEFVCVNCAAIPKDLLESELFGHEKGSFTGAESQRIGCCERADGGTLFLDEVGSMDVRLQSKMLRFLQDYTFTRVGGGGQALHTDTRVIAATNIDPAAQIADGRLRENLYYRLNVVPVELPPLRDRPEDIPVLAQHFLMVLGEKYSKYFVDFSADAMRLMLCYGWPGNVRQLQNVIERIVVLATADRITPELFPEEIRQVAAMAPPPELQVEEALRIVEQALKASAPEAPALEEADDVLPFDEVEKRAILDALRKCDGDISKAARKLGLSRATIYRKLEKYGER